MCDTACVVGISESAVSQHLRILRALRLVKQRKDGRMKCLFSERRSYIPPGFSSGGEVICAEDCQAALAKFFSRAGKGLVR